MIKTKKEQYIKDRCVTEDLMIDVDHVSMKFNLGIDSSREPMARSLANPKMAPSSLIRP
jgi:hypothetical protein